MGLADDLCAMMATRKMGINIKNIKFKCILYVIHVNGSLAQMALVLEHHGGDASRNGKMIFKNDKNQNGTRAMPAVGPEAGGAPRTLTLLVLGNEKSILNIIKTTY